MEVQIIEYFEVLTKYHSGIKEQEAIIITNLLKNGHCIFLECDQDENVKNWYVYEKKGYKGQLISGENFKKFKQNNYETQD